MNFLAIDFETATHSRDSACAVGLVKVVGGKITEKAAHLIRPPTPEFIFSYVHGLKWNDVKNAGTFATLWPRLSSLLDGVDFFAAHNAAFDRGVLNACCKLYGLAPPALPFRCTVRIARDTWSIYPTKLPDVCQRLGIELNHHDALSDAMACAKILLAANQN